MEEVVLKAQKRDVIGKQVKALRRAGRLPAVLYGRKFSPIAVTFDFKETSRIMPHVTSSQLVIIELEGEQHHALVRERQLHPVLGSLLHVDFNVVSMTEKLRANVSIHLVGESPAVKDYNGILVTALEELEVECLPSYLPERVDVDISVLKEIGDVIHVSDLRLAEQIEVLTDSSELVVLVTAPEAEEVEEAEVEAEAGEEPEVIERGRKEEEEF
jgi:large subunit ribosomal protein L25